MKDEYYRNATLVRVIDGDTVELNIDLGFRIWRRERVRLLGIDCPEVTGPTKVAGLAAKRATEEWLLLPSTVTVKTHLDKSASTLTDSFGRILAEIFSGGQSLNEHLVSTGHAVVALRSMDTQEQ